MTGSGPVPDPPGAYERGVAAGEIQQWLKRHDDHFVALNGSIANGARQDERVADELRALRLDVQRLTDRAEAAAATVEATAKALKEADEARRHAGEQRWSPWQKAIALAGVLLAVAGLVVTVLAIT